MNCETAPSRRRPHKEKHNPDEEDHEYHARPAAGNRRRDPRVRPGYRQRQDEGQEGTQEGSQEGKQEGKQEKEEEGSHRQKDVRFPLSRLIPSKVFIAAFGPP